MKYKTTKDVSHGDWKTASIHRDRYPMLKAGTEVEHVETWSNFYGRWVKVKAPNGSHYDVREDELTAIEKV